MPVCRTLLVLLVCASVGWGAELLTLKGEVIKGEVAGISDKEVVLSQGGKEVATPVSQVLQLDFGRPVGKLPGDAQYTDVELTDGTLLHCSACAIKGKEVEMTLLAGPTVKVPLSTLANLLNNAQKEKYRREWTERLSKKRRHDVLVRLLKPRARVRQEEPREGEPRKEEDAEPIIAGIEGTLGEGDESGQAITFTAEVGDQKITRSYALARLHGLIFERGPDPKATPVVCRLYDTYRDLVMVSAAASTPAGLTVTTPAGARIEYPAALVARMDYSKGKLTFLSDLQAQVVEHPPFPDVEPEHPRRDRNLKGDPLRLGSQAFVKGLAVPAYAELEYDLGGEYREFKAVVGVDDVGKREDPVPLRIEGDGRELYSGTFSRREKKRDHEVILNIKDVQKLRIIVGSDHPLEDAEKHLELCDAKVSK